MSSRPLVAVAVFLLSVVPGVPGAAAAQADPVARAQPAPQAIAAAAEIFQLRCASCHGEEPGYAPTRESLSSRSHAAIVAALTTGAMVPMAAGIAGEQIEALASYLSAAEDAPRILASVEQGFCGQPGGPVALGSGDWNGWAREEGSTRYQPEPGLTAADVPRLRVKWAFALDGGIHSQPTVVGDRVFISSVPGRLHSLDVSSGCVHWSYQTAEGAGGEWGGAGSRSTAVVGPIRGAAGTSRLALFLGDDLAYVHAVDASSGERIWRTRVDEHPVARITGSAVLHEGTVYVPLSSLEEAAASAEDYECCTFRGSIVALDAATGRVLWKTHTIPDEPKPHRISSSGTQMYGPAGGPIWSTPTVDAERNVLYAATGNSYTDISQAGSNSIIAFDLDTGDIRWSRQVREADNFIIDCPNGVNCPEDVGPDFDFGSSPILRRLPDGRDILVLGDKGGMVYGVDPEDEGRIIWSTRVGAGSALGGVQWGSAADSDLAYVAVSDYIAPAAKRRPGVNALRLDTGELVWHTPAPTPFCSWSGMVRCSSGHSAAISAMTGAVFSGSLDGHIRAYSTADGSMIWDFDTARLYQTVNGGVAQGGSLDAGGPTIANGTIFLTSGYGRFGRQPGNVLVAFTPGGR